MDTTYAQSMYATACEAKDRKVKEKCQKLLQQIEECAEEGYMNTSIHLFESEEIEFLKRKGFKINHFHASQYEISWDFSEE